ncbi:hypothetical protein OAM69_06110 [bacterium]|nr:hypothetical protein [bacterium]
MLALKAQGKLDVATLITNRYKFNDAVSAYNRLVEDTNAMGVVLEYLDAKNFLVRFKSHS